MLSGLEDEMLANVCLESGAIAVLQKPLEASQVQDLIRLVAVEHDIHQIHQVAQSLLHAAYISGCSNASSSMSTKPNY